MHHYHAPILPVIFNQLHTVGAILGKLGIGSTFSIYVMLAVTNSKHKLQSYATWIVYVLLFGFLLLQILVYKL
jgi:hypothetical protein